jgi:hypothetical protein
MLAIIIFYLHHITRRRPQRQRNEIILIVMPAIEKFEAGDEHDDENDFKSVFICLHQLFILHP